MKRLALLVPLALLLSACAVIVPRSAGPQILFWERLNALCGRSYVGRVVSNDIADSEMAASRLVMHVTACTPQYVRIAFHVGADRSRTWVIGRTAAGLRLKHYHRHSDGVEDVRSQYGGDTINQGSAFRQAFPADAFSRSLFTREGIPESNANIWSIEIAPGRMFGYELRRAGRFFRVEFDLTRTVPSPGPAWGPR
jgi:hypothetical protein